MREMARIQNRGGYTSKDFPCDTENKMLATESRR
jgi:hypothetical protein